MPGITVPSVEKYIYDILPRRDKVLREIEKYAKAHDVPIIGPAVGRLLFEIIRISGARRIFEMGSAIGYSIIWMARAVGPAGEVFYTEGDPKNARRAKTYISRAGIGLRVKMMTGNALQLIDRVRGDFDLIFIDVDKHQYPAALRKALPRLRHGGLLITDNVLWSGRVVKKSADANTRAIQKFNHMIYTSRILFPVIVPLRDGVAICRKN
ncbi:MAG: O-methyltransferase [Candidatus Acidiferrales bacterium]